MHRKPRNSSAHCNCDSANICLRAKLLFPVCSVISGRGQSWLSTIIYPLSLWEKFVSLLPTIPCFEIHLHKLIMSVSRCFPPYLLYALWVLYSPSPLFSNSVSQKSQLYLSGSMCKCVLFALLFLKTDNMTTLHKEHPHTASIHLQIEINIEIASLIRRMRWKTHLFLNQEFNTKAIFKKKYSFKIKKKTSPATQGRR